MTEDPGAGPFRRAVDVVYWAAAVFACVLLVFIAAINPWAVYTRYILNSASSWPEPAAVLLMIAITFIGTANCYRQRIHMHMTVGTELLPDSMKKACAFISELLMAAMAIFMMVWGTRLVEATWRNSVDEFPWLSVGITYLPIVIGGGMMLLYVIERLAIGAPPASDDPHIPVE